MSASNGLLKRFKASLFGAALLFGLPAAALAQTTVPGPNALPPNGVGIGCYYLGSTFTLPAAYQTYGCTMDSSGAIRVTVVSGGGGGGGGGAIYGATTPGTAPTGTGLNGVLNAFLNGSGNLTDVSTTNPLPVQGTFSATLTGYAPAGTAATLAASTTSANVALPAGTTVVVYNLGTNDVYVKLGTANTVTATATGDVVKAGQAISYTPGSNTYLAAITASGSSSLNIDGGSGLFTGVGGAGAAGGGGSAATQTASNASDAQATNTVNQQTLAFNMLFNGTTWDRARGTGGAANVIVTSSLPTGGNTIGGISNTAFGISGTLPAFAAIPTFKIDQTTPGTTNAVSVTNTSFATTAAASSYADGWDVTQGTKADAAYAGSGSSSVVAALKGIYAAASGPAQVAPPSYALLTSASSSGTAQSILGGNYALNLSGTFGGATVNIVQTFNNGTSVSTPYTAATSTTAPPTLCVYAGTTIQATVSGGSPSGLNATLAGSGACGGSSTSTGVAKTAQGSPTTATGVTIPVKLTAVAPLAGGSGYAVNDVITLAGGGAETVTVNTVTSGAVTSATVTTSSNLTTLPGSPRTQTSTTGAGTGATFTPTYTSQSTSLLAANASRGWYVVQCQGNPAYLGFGNTPTATPGGGLYSPTNARTTPDSGGRVPLSAINAISPAGVPVACYVEEYAF